MPEWLVTLLSPFLVAKFPDYKSTWSPDPIGHNPSHLSNKMWKNHLSSRNTTPLPRPPPGLTNPKPSSPWSSTAPRSVRGWGTQDSRLASGEIDPPQRASLFKGLVKGDEPAVGWWRIKCLLWAGAIAQLGGHLLYT